VHRGHDGIDALHRPLDTPPVAHVAHNDLRRHSHKMAGSTLFACQHPHIEAASCQLGHNQRAQPAGTTGDEDHPRTTCSRVWTYTSPELYELLVLRRGMPLQKYGEFVANAMIAALLERDTAI
jgi:hypothetical protein